MMDQVGGFGAERPSRWRERVILAVVAGVGFAVSVYLAGSQLGVVGSPWDPIFGPASSVRVLHSALARALPVPDAAVGALGYAVEIAADLAGGPERWRTQPWLVLAFAAVALGMGAVGLALAIVQAVMGSGCALCLCSAAASITVGLAVALGDELPAAWSTLSGRRRHRYG